MSRFPSAEQDAVVSALRARAATRQALSEALLALTQAALRFDAEKTKGGKAISDGASATAGIRRRAEDLEICRANVGRLEDFMRELDRRDLRMDSMVRLPTSIRHILMHYLHDALDPIFEVVARQGRGMQDRRVLHRWIAACEGDGAWMSV